MSADDPLELSPEEMREMAHLTVDLLVDMLADPRADPARRRAAPAEMRELIDGPPPEDARPYGELLDRLRSEVLPYRARSDHPGYFAFIPSNGTFPGALGDFIASALNVYADSWLDGAGPSQVELTVIDWFKEWIGYPPEATGVLVSGGSAANLTALACARESIAGGMREDLVLYASDQGHSSIARAARALGFGPSQLRVLPADDEYRMRPDAVEGAISDDLAAGRTPLAVCASAGSTNTGAVDPLHELADLCAEHNAWLHVDGAYGGFAALTERGRRLLSGIERADSVTLDPHKWLYQSWECGCVLVRDGELLRDAFQISPDYLMDVDPADREVNLSDRGLQLSRMWRALKVWLSVSTFGAGAFRAAVDRALDLARLAQARVEESDQLELLRPATLGVVCFRRRFGSNLSEREVAALNRRLIAGLEESGMGVVSSTRLRGTFAIRLVVLNHTTEVADVDSVLDWMESVAVEDLPGPETAKPGEPGGDRNQRLEAGWAAGGEVTPEALRSISLFENLTAEQLEQLASTAETTRAAPGENITTRWGGGRDFYVILEGRARVEVNGEVVREQGPGEFFGELAALDWGAGYGYTRTASVIAEEPIELLLVPSEALNHLVRTSPGLDETIRAAVRERLPRS